MDATQIAGASLQEEQQQRVLVQKWLRRHLKEYTVFKETCGRNHAQIMSAFLQETNAQECWDAYLEANRIIGRFMAELKRRQLTFGLLELDHALTNLEYRLPTGPSLTLQSERSLFMVDVERTMLILQWILEVPWEMLEKYLEYSAKGLGRWAEFFELAGAHLTKRLFSAAGLPTLEEILQGSDPGRPGEALLKARYQSLEGLTIPGQGHALAYGQWPMALNVAKDCMRVSTYRGGGRDAKGIGTESFVTMHLSTEQYRVYGHQFCSMAEGLAEDILEGYPKAQQNRITAWQFLLPEVSPASQIGLFPKAEYDYWASRYPEFVCCRDCPHPFGAIVFERPEDAEEFQVYREGKKKGTDLPFRVLFG